jgi:hypothetical protein
MTLNVKDPEAKNGIYKWETPLHNANMTLRLTLERIETP